MVLMSLRQGNINSLATKMRVGNTQKVSGKLLPSLLFFHTVGDLLPRGRGALHILKGWGCSSEILNETLKETNLGVAQAFFDP